MALLGETLYLYKALVKLAVCYLGQRISYHTSVCPMSREWGAERAGQEIGRFWWQFGLRKHFGEALHKGSQPRWGALAGMFGVRHKENVGACRRARGGKALD